jgi:hypothetical protein
MGESTHRARQHEQPAAERRREAQLGVDHGGGAIDVHRDALAALAPGQRLLDGPADRGEATTDHASGCCRLDHLEQPRCAWIDRVEAMAEAGHELDAALGHGRQLGLDRRRERQAAVHAGGDRLVDLDALLAGTAVHVAQDIDRRGHGVVDADAAGRGHAGDGDRRCLRPVIDRRHERRAEEIGLTLARQLAAQHQPDHRRKADPADEILDRVAAIADHARPHLDDRGRPPILARYLVGGLAHALAPWSCEVPRGRPGTGALAFRIRPVSASVMNRRHPS